MGELRERVQPVPAGARVGARAVRGCLELADLEDLGPAVRARALTAGPRSSRSASSKHPRTALAPTRAPAGTGWTRSRSSPMRRAAGVEESSYAGAGAGSTVDSGCTDTRAVSGGCRAK